MKFLQGTCLGTGNSLSRLAGDLDLNPGIIQFFISP